MVDFNPFENVLLLSHSQNMKYANRKLKDLVDVFLQKKKNKQPQTNRERTFYLNVTLMQSKRGLDKMALVQKDTTKSHVGCGS